MKKNSFKIILLILVLIFFFLVIRSTYSKYLTQTDDNASLHIANWNIKLNDKDISESKNFTSNVPIVLDENDYVEKGLIAPTSSGSFNLKLESTGTELPFKYSLDVAGEGDFDTVSTYELSITNGPWNSSGHNAVNFSFNLNYSYRENPVQYWENGQTICEKIPITITFPGVTIINVNIYCNTAEKYFSGNTFTFVPDLWVWQSNNTLSCGGQIIYDGELPEGFGNVSVDGLLIGNAIELPDFKITSYTRNGSDPIPVDVNASFSEIVTPPVDENGNFTGEEVINDYTFHFEWYDGEGNVLNNYEDVNMTKITSSAYIPLTLSVVQLEEANLENDEENNTEEGA